MDKKILDHLSGDPVLGRVIRELEPPQIRQNGEVYTDLLRSIVSQQLSVKAAATIFGRFLDLSGGVAPEPAKLIDLPFEALRGVGLSQQKSAYVKNVATFFAENPNISWPDLSDKEILEKLTAIKGVGKWTTEMILLFTLHRPDIFPIDDLGIRQSMCALYNVELTGKELIRRLHEIAAPWQPYRSYASRYLWHWKDKAGS